MKPSLSEDLKYDIPASVVVFFVAVPLCLGIALASGAPLFAGLVAGIVGGIVVGSISGSALGVSGPAAGLAVIVLHTIERLDTFETFLMAVVLAGVLQILLGAMRAGVLAYFFPSSVIKGMLAGIGILIILKQVPHAFGHDSDPEGDLGFVQPDGETTFSSLGSMLGDFSESAVFVSLFCLTILIVWEAFLVKRSQIFRIIPGPLVAVAFGILFQWFTSWFAPALALDESHLVSVPIAANPGEALGLLRFPEWAQIGNPAVWTAALTIAVVASLETLLCVEATDKLDPQKRVTPTNRELLAQGIGNITSGAIGGLPITQVIVRSSANIQSGGRTKRSAILHGALILIFVIILPQILNMIPLATLASILFVVGFKLARPSLWRQMFELGWDQFLPFAITVSAIVFTDLLTGIALGMVAAIFSILRSHYMNSHFMQIRATSETDGRNQIVIRLAEQVTFLNRAAILKALKEIPSHSDVTIEESKSLFVDHDVLEIIQDFEENAANRDIKVSRLQKAESGAHQKAAHAN